MKWKDGFLIALISGMVGYLLCGYLSLGSIDVPLNGLWLALGFLAGVIGGSDLLAFFTNLYKERKEKSKEEDDKERIYNWLYNETKKLGHSLLGEPNNPRWISTIDIARHTHLPIDRVKEICIKHEKIILMGKEDLWPHETLEEKWAIKEFVKND